MKTIEVGDAFVAQKDISGSWGITMRRGDVFRVTRASDIPYLTYLMERGFDDNFKHVDEHGRHHTDYRVSDLTGNVVHYGSSCVCWYRPGGQKQEPVEYTGRHRADG